MIGPLTRAAIAAGVAVLALAAPSLADAPAGARRPVAATAGGGTLGATVSFSAGGRPIPPAFYGLSMEYNELPTFEHQGAVFDRVLSMIRPRDGGPMLLKLGGKSADHALWEPKPPKAPPAKASSLPAAGPRPRPSAGGEREQLVARRLHV